MASRNLILSPGDQLAGFRIIKPLAAGGMAVVYEAEQLTLERRVALKVIAAQIADEDEFRRRFVREGKHVASLHHPNIVPVYDAGEQDGALFIAMRLMEGGTLQQRMDSGEMARAEFASIFGPLSNALDYAHRQGVVHRDIKPGNILFDADDIPHLADFGIARSANDATALTSIGGFVGSAHYASPEQIRGEQVGSASDIYSLAVVEYLAVSGRLPFAGGSQADVLEAHLEKTVPSVAQVLGGQSHTVDAALRRGMAKSPSDRWPTATAMTEEVAAQIDGLDMAETTSIEDAETLRSAAHDSTSTASRQIDDDTVARDAEPAEPARVQTGSTDQSTQVLDETVLDSSENSGTRELPGEQRDEGSGPRKSDSRKPWLVASSLVLLIALTSLGVVVSQRESDVNSDAPAAETTTPESRSLRLVFNEDRSEAMNAKAALDRGASWSSVVKKYSMDSVSKSNGGEFDGVQRQEFPAELDEAVFSAEVGEVSDLIETQYGFYVFEVVQID